MKAITQAELVLLLETVKGATFATLVTETDPKLKKTGNPFGEVRKVSRVNVTLGFQYENAVNRQREREGSEPDFEAAPRQWGRKISPMFVEHKGELYLETKVERSIETKYLDSLDREIPAEALKPFLPSRSESSRQETEKEIIVRDYKLASIASLTVRGESYIVIRSAREAARVA